MNRSHSRLGSLHGVVKTRVEVWSIAGWGGAGKRRKIFHARKAISTTEREASKSWVVHAVASAQVRRGSEGNVTGRHTEAEASDKKQHKGSKTKKKKIKTTKKNKINKQQESEKRKEKQVKKKKDEKIKETAKEQHTKTEQRTIPEDGQAR